MFSIRRRQPWQPDPVTPPGPRNWPVTLPMYDGRRCPECHATVIGKRGQHWHYRWHYEDRQWHDDLESRMDDLEARIDGNGDRGPAGPVRGLPGRVISSAADLGPQPTYAEGEDGG